MTAECTYRDCICVFKKVQIEKYVPKISEYKETTKS